MSLPPEAYAAAIAAMGMGPVRLRTLLAGRTPCLAWVCAGGHDDAAVDSLWASYQAAEVQVHVLGTDGYPAVLADDPEAPAVLFSRGSLEALDRPRVSIVGTRRCSQTGREVARQLGRELVGAGVAVVSGLALGIDGAAHEGALAAFREPLARKQLARHLDPGRPPVGHDARFGSTVGVVGSGLDVVYPARHQRLWTDVATTGLLLSEAPLGARPEAWRFPARNRILAALADVVVVVESHTAGGSLHTVRAAVERGVTVMAVPGSVRNPAAAGTNQLLSEGLPPARDTDDVLVALGMATSGPGPGLLHDRTTIDTDGRPLPDGEGAAVLEAVGWEAASLEDVLARTSLTPGRAAVALSHLEEAGWLRRTSGWYERVGA